MVGLFLISCLNQNRYTVNGDEVSEAFHTSALIRYPPGYGRSTSMNTAIRARRVSIRAAVGTLTLPLPLAGCSPPPPPLPRAVPPLAAAVIPHPLRQPSHRWSSPVLTARSPARSPNSR